MPKYRPPRRVNTSSRMLPSTFDLKRKQGFAVPLSQWLDEKAFRELFRDVLCDPSCIFDQRAIQDLLREQDTRRNNAERLFGLVHFELWRRELGATL